MRLWSLHPSLLDAKGLVALWRETLLAQHVLQGKTKGYRNHPQLDRFKKARNPLKAIAAYLWAVQDEAVARGYRFDQSKICAPRSRTVLKVTRGQMAYEFEWLQTKLRKRDPARFKASKKTKPHPHPLFTVIPGTIEDWERIED